MNKSLFAIHMYISSDIITKSLVKNSIDQH